MYKILSNKIENNAQQYSWADLFSQLLRRRHLPALQLFRSEREETIAIPRSR
jgi:hypothetical protein